MTIKIDKAGYLYLERGEKMKLQYCPKQDNEEGSPCGDWCPLFLEPEHENIPAQVVLTICEGLEFITKEEFFTDEREGK